MLPSALSYSDYPALDPSDAGLRPNVGYGSVDGVRAHCIVSGATTSLAAAITASDTAFSVSDASRFPAPPFKVQVAAEVMTVGAVAGSTFSSVTRGGNGTSATAHAKGRAVYEVRTEYVYLISPEPVKAVRAVAVDGVVQSSGYTPYTGQAGNSHTDWPGMAVIAFSASVSVSKQTNVSSASTSSVTALISAASHQDLMDAGSSYGVPLTGKRNRAHWVSFTGSGTITSQSFAASVKNLAATDAVVIALIKETVSGLVLRHDYVLVPASTTKTVTLSLEGGIWETTFALLPYTGTANLEVSYMQNTVTAVAPPKEESCETYSPPPTMLSFRSWGAQKTVLLSPKKKNVAWAAYPSTSKGAIVSQKHSVSLYNTAASAASALVLATSTLGVFQGRAVLKIAASASETVTLTHSGGDWDTVTKVVCLSGSVRVDDMSKTVSYLSGSDAGDTVLTATARAVIGDEVTVDADWALDPTGEYGGLGSLVDRPDRVLKHFIVGRMGFSTADVDQTSFDAAGASYAAAISGGYKFGLVINEEVTPSDYLRDLAFQCRSTVRYDRGKWYLSYVPDTAPAPVKTVSNAGLAGEGSMFVFASGKIVDLGNSLTACYRRSYAGSGSDWGAVITAEDATSITKYGRYAQALEFGSVRSDAMAAHVLAHMLLERSVPLMTVEFPVFYEHFDLRVGDTVQVDNPLYNGRKFAIEKIERQDKFRAKVTARQWWA